MVLTKQDKIGIGVGATAAAIVGIIALTKQAHAVPEVKLSNLTINPNPCNPNQQITIAITARNDFDVSLSRTIYLGGDFMAEQNVSLDAGESKVVSFIVTPTVAKTFHVSVDGLSGSFVCTEAPVANIVLSALAINPASCYIGETVEISLEATNIGNVSGSRIVTCTVT